MRRMEDFYKLVGANSEFKQVVAGVGFLSYVYYKVMESVNKVLFSYDDDFILEDICNSQEGLEKYVLEDLYDYGVYLLDMCGEVEEFSVEGILDMKDGMFRDTCKQYIISNSGILKFFGDGDISEKDKKEILSML